MSTIAADIMRAKVAFLSIPSERVLPDDCPVHAGFHYMGDGHPVIALNSGTVADLKRLQGFREVMNCDVFARGIKID